MKQKNHLEGSAALHILITDFCTSTMKWCFTPMRVKHVAENDQQPNDSFRQNVKSQRQRLASRRCRSKCLPLQIPRPITHASSSLQDDGFVGGKSALRCMTDLVAGSQMTVSDRSERRNHRDKDSSRVDVRSKCLPLQIPRPITLANASLQDDGFDGGMSARFAAE